MGKTRLEAFSDAVIAIVITIMILELKIPHSADWAALRTLGTAFCAYVLSFIYLGIYWNNHHHLFHACHRVNGKILWANLHLLFWLSLIPATTAWLGESHVAPLPTAVYGAVLILCAAAWTILKNIIVATEGSDSVVAQAVGDDRKGRISLACYATAIPVAFLAPLVSCALYVVVALLWLVPDTRLESRLAS